MAAAAKAITLIPAYYHQNGFPLLDPSSIQPNFRSSNFYRQSARFKHTRNPSFLPIIKAQSTPDYVPGTEFYKIEAILRPWRTQQVSSALLRMGIRGVTVSDVRGFGAQGGLPERQAGSEYSEDKFVAKVKMEIVVTKDQVEEVLDKIIEESRTGEIGDGKIFLVPIADVIRVRTGERGKNAERMSGGRADTYSTSAPGLAA